MSANDRKAVYVIGAGASSEVNLPTGQALKEEISKSLDLRFDDFGSKLVAGDHAILEALRNATYDVDLRSMQLEAWQIRDALPLAISIDNFLDCHRESDTKKILSKLAIVLSILRAESKSPLFIEEGRQRDAFLNHKSLKATWYNKFFQILTENCQLEDLPSRLSSVALVVFNYDRCIEHFLFNSFRLYYGVTREIAAELVDQLEIHHPYGVVGWLPWQFPSNAVGFGGHVDSLKLMELASQIKTFTEGTDAQSSDVLEIQRCIQSSEKIIFLGFAFHKINLELLCSDNEDVQSEEEVRFFGTAIGLSESDCSVIDEDLLEMIGRPTTGAVLRNDLTCSDFLDEYSRTLSLVR